MTDLADLTIAQASAGLRTQEFSAADLLDAVERRAAITEAHLHAYLTLDREGSRAAAAAADTALATGDPRPLLGIPIALKDNMVTRGVETTASSQILAGWKPGDPALRRKSAGRSPRGTVKILQDLPHDRFDLPFVHVATSPHSDPRKTIADGA